VQAGIDALGAASELYTLQLFDDGFDTLDLGVTMIDRSSNVADQAPQEPRIGRQIAEIELHVRWYSNTLISARQTMPSISVASRAGVSVIEPS
jgi:hypothetical protein